MPSTNLAIPLASFAAMLVATPITSAQAALDCRPVPSNLTFDVSAPEPVIDNSLPQPALQGLAGKTHHRGRTLGLYIAKIKTSVRILINSRSTTTETCRWIETVAVELRITDRTIYVIRERKPGTCPYDIVLGHERKHQAVDEAILRDHVPRLREEIEQAIAHLPQPKAIPVAQGAALDKRLFAAVRGALDRGMARLERDRALRQQDVDTPAEYRRVGAGCG